jgi:hypothetical protein
MSKEGKPLFLRVGQRVIGREAYNRTLNAGEDKSEAKINQNLQIFAPLMKNSIDNPNLNPFLNLLDGPKMMMGFAADVVFNVGPALAALQLHAPPLVYPIAILGSKLLYNSGIAFLEEKSKK